MEVNNASLAAVGVKLEQYPTDGKPEIAFAGKSNVGKSSLINGLLNRKSLARTSSNPGKTRTINFYDVENTLYFVDLPGYGYAKAPKTEIQKWGKMIEDYLYQRETLKSIVLLIDIRHEPGNNDKMMYDWLKHYNYDIIIIATKADKIKRSQLQKHIAMIRKGLNMSAEDKIIPFSSMTKQGKEEIWSVFDELVGYTKE
ncbi:MAG: YihA family ribosome biogenesis GTP-binding protein [Tyzzerella sp.]|uniref:Probable GTP-binding protein EngB n=1 Tax=Candidatus Fimicola merdigallinarum TaxID=2840819 RepID=A0A9D9DVV6_9FIRM|nr:YihA family ribosome biogenesis GTP-binding protein [Candidatus Fimicola merdigallinarum]